MLRSHRLTPRVKSHTSKNNISQQSIPCKDNEVEERWERPGRGWERLGRGWGSVKALFFWHGGLIYAADEPKTKLT